MIGRATRLLRIQSVFVKYGLDSMFLELTPYSALQYYNLVFPGRWRYRTLRQLPRGARIRRALEELGPVFVKLGQILSTRRDLLPDDIGDELALLQDRVPPFSSDAARRRIEQSLGDTIDSLFDGFENRALASASVAQVHAARLRCGRKVVVKVLRPGVERAIERDVTLMYLLAEFAAFALPDGRRLRPREVVEEYERTLEGELDLMREGTNAALLRSNFEGSDKLYVPEVIWEFTRRDVMVMERIHGIPIRDVAAMHALGMDMRKLAEHGVEIFYKQVFEHNFFHADMHPGNIFVSPDNPDYPLYIAVDFGIVGSLTEEDQRYIGENMLAFFRRDYRRVAELHVDSGWVPRGTRVSELESAIRVVCDPIFEKPLAEISFGHVLLQLFRTARRFNMEVQPQLVLLQKTLLNIEGLGRQLYPELDLWATGKPFLERWMKARNDPRVLLRKLIEQGPEVMRVLPALPVMLHHQVSLQNRLVEDRLAGSQHAAHGAYMPAAIGGSALLVCAALLGSASMLAGRDTAWWIWGLAVAGGLLLIRSARRAR